MVRNDAGCIEGKCGQEGVLFNSSWSEIRLA